MTKKDLEFLECCLEVYYESNNILLPEKIKILNFLKFVDENLDELNEVYEEADKMVDAFEKYGECLTDEQITESEPDYDDNEYSFDSLLQKYMPEGSPDTSRETELEYCDDEGNIEQPDSLEQIKENIDTGIKIMNDEERIKINNDLVKSIKTDIKNHTNIYNASDDEFKEMFTNQYFNSTSIDYRVVSLREVLDTIKRYKIKKEKS